MQLTLSSPSHSSLALRRSKQLSRTPTLKTYTEQVGDGAEDNPYHPFTTRMEWEVARWAKLRGSGSTAFSDLLAIEGVRIPFGFLLMPFPLIVIMAKVAVIEIEHHKRRIRDRKILNAAHVSETVLNLDYYHSAQCFMTNESLCFAARETYAFASFPSPSAFSLQHRAVMLRLAMVYTTSQLAFLSPVPAPRLGRTTHLNLLLVSRLLKPHLFR